MDKQRTLLTGVGNIIRFNWHFYAVGLGVVFMLFALAIMAADPLRLWLITVAIFGFIPLLISTIVSWYIYDLSGLYELNWIKFSDDFKPGTILNIHAGFDETSLLIREKFPLSNMKVYDFYDAKKHTEISIKRARKAYPPYPGSRQINTAQIPEADNSTDAFFLIFAAHEIRKDEERTIFFTEVKRVLRQHGTVHVVEHLRDLPNFLAYTLGFFHFLPAATWYKTFSNAGFNIKKAKRINPFVTHYILQK